MCTYRYSNSLDYADTVQLVRDLVNAVPERLVWGSDFPHVGHEGKYATEDFLYLLEQWVPDVRALDRILVENPRTLYG